MLVIDGSFGEGGGQILRTTLALSALTGTKVKIVNIRAKRPNPGLQPQHIAAVRAVAEFTEAEVTGLELLSSKIEFSPKGIKRGELSVNVGTAGSVTLILQSLMPTLLKAPSSVKLVLTGGTDVNWSPPFNYLSEVHLALLEKFGYKGRISLLNRGYYPKGGGRIKAEFHPARIEPITIKERPQISNIRGVSFAEDRLMPAKVAERQALAALKVLQKRFPSFKIEIKEEYGRSLSLGSGIVIWAETETTILGADSLGEKGKRAEKVGEEAARDLISELDSGACLDRYMADQIVPYLALAGGEATVSQATGHALTNIEVVKKFGFDVIIERNTIIAKGLKASYRKKFAT